MDRNTYENFNIRDILVKDKSTIDYELHIREIDEAVDKASSAIDILKSVNKIKKAYLLHGTSNEFLSDYSQKIEALSISTDNVLQSVEEITTNNINKLKDSLTTLFEFYRSKNYVDVACTAIASYETILRNLMATKEKNYNKIDLRAFKELTGFGFDAYVYEQKLDGLTKVCGVLQTNINLSSIDIEYLFGDSLHDLGLSLNGNLIYRPDDSRIYSRINYYESGWTTAKIHTDIYRLVNNVIKNNKDISRTKYYCAAELQQVIHRLNNISAIDEALLTQLELIKNNARNIKTVMLYTQDTISLMARQMISMLRVYPLDK